MIFMGLCRGRAGNRPGRAGLIVDGLKSGRIKIGMVFSDQNINSPVRHKNQVGRAK